MPVPGFLPRLGFSCLLAVLPALAPISAHAQTQNPSLVKTAASLTRRLPIPGHRPAWAIPSADRGTLPDTQPVELLIALNRPPALQAAFDQLLADQQNPASPRFHQWLTPQQIGLQFGASQSDLDALITWITAQGIHLDAVTPARNFVQVSAPAAVIAAAFGTSLHLYQVDTQILQAPAAEPTLPAALAPLIAHIGGLTSVPVHTHAHMQPQTITIAPGTLHPSLTTSISNHFLTPADFNKIYDIPTTLTGSGQRVMIVGGSRLAPADLNQYESDTAIPLYTPTYLVDPAYADPGQTLDGTQGEATLDVDRVHGTAPAAQVDLVIAANWLNGTVNQNLILYAINTVNDPVLSLSFGACENLQPTGYVRLEDAMYAQAAAQGITTIASSGDSGVSGCAQHSVAPTTQYAYPNISDICASSYVTCVGGTQFNDTANPAAYWNSANATGLASALSYIPEGAWNEPNNPGANSASVPYVIAATGGGPSTIIPKPTWQTGTGVPADGFRDTPDVSFAAALHDGYFLCLASAGTIAQDTGCIPIQNANGSTSFGFVDFSGTSASAPSMAGIAALLNARLGGRQGNLNPLLYQLAASAPAVFHDITPATAGLTSCSSAAPSLCNNTTPGQNNLTTGVPGYQLQTGYDLVTGLGSLDVAAFLDAASVSPTTYSGALVALPANITTTQSVIFTETVSASSGSAPPTGATGTVVFTSGSTTLATVALTATPGTASVASTPALFFPTAGTYLITATYYVTGSSTATGSSTLSFTVTAPILPATLTTLAGTTGTITAQTPATYTATIAPTVTNTLAPSGNVQFIRTSTLTGQTTNLSLIPIAAGKATLPPIVLPTGAYSISAVYLGDLNFAGSTSNPLAVTSTAIPTTTILAGLPATVTSATTSSVTVTVVSSTGTGAPTGPIQFTVDTVNSGPAILLTSGGSGSAITSPTPLVLPAGTHSVCAVYSGNLYFAASTSTCTTVTSTLTPVTLALAAGTNTLTSYQLTTLTGTLNGISTAALPTGQVTFTDVFTPTSGATSTSSLGSAPLTGTSPAGLIVGPLAAGTHLITATYPGDQTYSAATSNSITLTVTPASLTLTPGYPTLTTTAGIPATDSITLTSVGFAGSENLTCTVTFAGRGSTGALPACSLSPATITFSGSGITTSTLTLTSLKRSSVRPTSFSALRTRTLAGLTLCTLVTLCIPRRRKLLRSLQLTASTLFFTLILFTLSGCGAGNFNGFPSGPGGSNPTGTAAGSYTITLTAAGTTTATTTISLTIQ